MSLRDERKQQSRQALLDAALALSTAGRSFSNISLREVAREAGLVPTAFYRHFQDMDELGTDLVDQVSLSLHHLLKSLREGYGVQTASSKTRLSIERFFQAVDQSPLQWEFLIGERFGGSTAVRHAIEREIHFFIDDLAQDLQKMADFKNITQIQDIKLMADMLINLALSWAMTWLNLPKNADQSYSAAHQQLIEHTTRQAQLLFSGMKHWQQRSTEQ